VTSKAKKDVRPGTVALMVLKTLDLMGPQHGWGIARRIELRRTGPIAIDARGRLLHQVRDAHSGHRDRSFRSW
jgi:hypothetical protein